MAQLTYSNPQGQSDSSIGIDNFQLPFTGDLRWNLSGGSAIDITTASASRAIRITNNGVAISANTGLLEYDSSAPNTNPTASMLRITQSSTGHLAPFARLRTGATAAQLDYVVVEDLGGAAYWQVQRNSDAIRYNVPTGWEHHIAVNGTNVAEFEASRFYSPLSIESDTQFKVGDTTLVDSTLSFNGTANIVGSATEVQLPQGFLRFGTSDTGILQHVGNETLEIQNALRIHDPVIPEGALLDNPGNYTLRLRENLELYNGAVSATLNVQTHSGATGLGVGSNHIFANALPAVVSSTPGAMRIIRGSVFGPGNKEHGEGFAVAKSAAGQYTITFKKENGTTNQPFSDPPVIVGMAKGENNDNQAWIVEVVSVTTTEAIVYTRRTDSEDRTDRDFHFIVIGPR